MSENRDAGIRPDDESPDGRDVARREGFGGAIENTDDVEGHSMTRRGPDGLTRREGEGLTRREGEGLTRREGEGLTRRVTGDDDDVEGHRMVHGPEGLTRREGESLTRRVTGDEDDVEGHSFRLRGGATRGE